MITLKIGDNSYQIRDSWDDVTLSQFIEFTEISTENTSDFSKFVKILCAFSVDCDRFVLESELMNLSIDDFNVLKDEFLWIQNITDFEKTGKDKFSIDGVDYVMKKNYDRLTVGEMVSLETLIRDKQIDATPMEIAFAILFRRTERGVEKEFDTDDFIYVLKNMKDRVKAVDVISHINFFLRGDTGSIPETSKVSSTLQIQKTNSEG